MAAAGPMPRAQSNTLDGGTDIGPAIGARIRVYWTQERRWFKGTVMSETLEDGKRIHKIAYDDGEVLWHCMAGEIWLLLTGKAAASGAAASGPGPPSVPRACNQAAAKKARAKKARGANGASIDGAACPAARSSAPPISERSASPPARARLEPTDVEIFPCGVIKVKSSLSQEERQALWDTVICAGFDYREVGQDAVMTDPDFHAKRGANRLYTQAKGAPDILLHYNYYEKPAPQQPPPISILRAADAVFRAVAELDIAQQVLESEGDDAESAGGEEEADETEGESDYPAAAAGEPEDAFFARHAEMLRKKNLQLAAAMLEAHKLNAGERKLDAGEPPQPASGGGTRQEQQMFLWPRRPNFRSVLAIGYKPCDTFRWHTDLAGEEGWVCSLSVGATSVFEYLPTAAPNAVRRVRAHQDCEAVRIELESGDALLFNGGLLAHRHRLNRSIFFSVDPSSPVK